MIIKILNDITPTRLVHRLQIVGALEHHHRLKRIVPSGQIVRNYHVVTKSITRKRKRDERASSRIPKLSAHDRRRVPGAVHH
jgi:hypothetical protein